MRYQYAILTLVLALFSSTSAYALEFKCEIGEDKRFLRVEIPGQEHLCEVSVTYQTGARRVLWYANQDTQFCSTKAYELRDKYINEWNFSCESWPDLDGIDSLSSRHRIILDTQLKNVIAAGRSSAPPFLVESLRATASPANDTTSSSLALQYFLSTGDMTQLIVDDGQEWQVMAEIDELALQVESDIAISAALVESITDTGALQIITVIDNDAKDNDCFGSQVLVADSGSQLTARTPHRYVCE